MSLQEDRKVTWRMASDCIRVRCSSDLDHDRYSAILVALGYPASTESRSDLSPIYFRRCLKSPQSESVVRPMRIGHKSYRLKDMA